VHNEIPFGRGLGSSGAAVIAGVMLANELGRLGLPLTRMLDFALMVERHPDNVTAAACRRLRWIVPARAGPRSCRSG